MSAAMHWLRPKPTVTFLMAGLLANPADAAKIDIDAPRERVDYPRTGQVYDMAAHTLQHHSLYAY
jgi:hypothetical protein